MMGDQGGQCYVFFTNGEECGNNTAWKYCSVLSSDQQGTHFYSLLPIPAGNVLRQALMAPFTCLSKTYPLWPQCPCGEDAAMFL